MRPKLALLVLQRQRPGTFALLIAATCLLMLLAAALTLALRGAAQEVTTAVSKRVLVQVVDADPIRRDSVADEVMARLDRILGFGSAHRVPTEEAQALIAPYMDGVRVTDLPLPVLIELKGGNRAAIAQSFRDLPSVQVTAAGAELDPLVRLIDALRAVSLGIALTAAAATALIAMLAARAALAREAATLGILHALGATDRQVSRLVTGKIARDAGIGAAIGSTVALIVILMIASRVAEVGAGVNPHLTPQSWIILLLMPLALVGLAVLAAQTALVAALRRAL
ncbi:MAG TPA: FtsX-like permease family protein [Sphingomonas sp.]|uniref:FtsX-like permease family protein n=1 Tax=Sphingomonas sp. TaxID=28214 RepID=UPI002BFEF2BE|nr:FtsX-like permease family protein [Sphingomonas sp.]HMI19567.1 FtsX-like permease family protein [Sphingomonas sp.]